MFTEEELKEEREMRAMLRGEIAGPVWPDGCNHNKAEYIASFKVLKLDGTGDEYDVYVFDQPTLGAEVCIRYGSEPHQYISPGELSGFLQRSLLHNDEVYKTTAEIILAYGIVRYERKKR